MVYLIFGGNAYTALGKIRELKNAFLKKAGESASIADFSEEELSQHANEIFSQLFQDSLFYKRKLAVIRNASLAPDFFKLIKESAELFKNSRNIFIFWESMAATDKESAALKVLKKNSEKTQEVKVLSEHELDLWLQKKAGELGLKFSKEEREIMISEAGEGAEWALEGMLEKRFLEGESCADEKITHPTTPLHYFKGGGLGEGFSSSSPAPVSPFAFVEKLVSAPFGHALLALKEAEASGQDLQRLIYPLLWKIKQKKMPDAYWQGILAESAMRRSPKNAYEILERFILAIKA